MPNIACQIGNISRDHLNSVLLEQSRSGTGPVQMTGADDAPTATSIAYLELIQTEATTLLANVSRLASKHITRHPGSDKYRHLCTALLMEVDAFFRTNPPVDQLCCCISLSGVSFTNFPYALTYLKGVGELLANTQSPELAEAGTRITPATATYDSRQEVAMLYLVPTHQRPDRPRPKFWSRAK